MEMPNAERKGMGARARDYYEQHYSNAQFFGNLETWLLEAAQLPVK